jgi:hypothetical protein
VAFRVLTVAFIVLLGGCGNNERNLQPVSGTIRYKGQPLPNASVAFVPDENGVRGATATTDHEGRYRLTSFEINDGARVGTYRVAIRAVDRSDETPDNPRLDQLNPKPRKVLTPVRYAAIDTSGLTAEVAHGKKNVFDFDLTD